MNREEINRIRGLIAFTIVMLIIGINYRSVLGLASLGFRIILPFLLGAAIAFVLNVPMRKIETWIAPGKIRKYKRPLSLILTITAVTSVLLIVLLVVFPELFRTLYSLQESVPAFLNHMKAQLETLFAQEPAIAEYISSINIDWDGVVGNILGFLSTGAGTVLSSTVSAAMSIVSGITTFGIALIFAIYLLLQKEVLRSQIKKAMRAYLPEKTNLKILQIATLSEHTFSSFLAGQCLEAVILGTMFFVTMSVLRMPYAVLIGVLLAFTALIPVFGAFIGCAVGVFLMLLVNPVAALKFLVTFFLLQQIEGNLIYPHVVGNSVGLPAIWVLVAVTIGGSAFGIVGMLVFIPLCSVLYALFRDSVNQRLNPRIKGKKHEQL